MSLMKTLAKVAIGVAVAKGIGSVMQSRSGSASAEPRGGQTYGGRHSPEPGGFADQMGDLLGNGARRDTADASAGGLGDLLEQLSQGGAQSKDTTSRGSLDDLLGNLGGQSGNAGGGLGDMLKGLQGGGSGGGGIGDLLGGLLGAAPSRGADAGGGFGDLLNQSLRTGREPDVAPSPAQEAGAALMLRAMIQAAKSDGKIDQAERDKLLNNLGEDVTSQEKAFVNHELAQPVDVAGLAAQVPAGMEQQIYMMSLMGIDLDNRNEAQYLHDLATALSIAPVDVNSVHDSLGVPRIYQ